MNTPKSDIVVLGATGYTGRLISRYLASHPQFQANCFSFSVAGRSQSKLHTLVQELSLPPNVCIIQVDVTDGLGVENIVKSCRIVINTVGPYWRWGTPVVRACARNGVHYVDLTGESHWVKDVILEFDYLASKTGSVIVPGCGMDSIPSDLSAFLCNKTLKAQGDYNIANCVTAFNIWGGISGGTISSAIAMLEEVPATKIKASSPDYSLSPVKGRSFSPFRFLYRLQIPREKSIAGAFFFMQPTNKKVVQRTFGLLELQALQEHAKTTQFSIPKSLKLAQQERYGPSFAYDEFLAMHSRIVAALFTTVFAIGFALLVFVAPIRWIVKRFVPQPGDGPSDEQLLKGHITCINHATSASSPPLHVKTVMKGTGDPGYYLTSIMISESALSLILPNSSLSMLAPPTHSNLPAGLPSLAYKGGVLTPMSAFGEVLIARLKESGKFKFESRIVHDSTVLEDRKVD